MTWTWNEVCFWARTGYQESRLFRDIPGAIVANGSAGTAALDDWLSRRANEYPADGRGTPERGIRRRRKCSAELVEQHRDRAGVHSIVSIPPFQLSEAVQDHDAAPSNFVRSVRVVASSGRLVPSCIRWLVQLRRMTGPPDIPGREAVSTLMLDVQNYSPDLRTSPRTRPQRVGQDRAPRSGTDHCSKGHNSSDR